MASHLCGVFVQCDSVFILVSDVVCSVLCNMVECGICSVVYSLHCVM